MYAYIIISCLNYSGELLAIANGTYLVDCRWDPEHLAVGVDQNVGFVPNLVVAVSTR